jgi:hypothetical protein
MRGADREADHRVLKLPGGDRLPLKKAAIADIFLQISCLSLKEAEDPNFK